MKRALGLYDALCSKPSRISESTRQTEHGTDHRVESHDGSETSARKGLKKGVHPLPESRDTTSTMADIARFWFRFYASCGLPSQNRDFRTTSPTVCLRIGVSFWSLGGLPIPWLGNSSFKTGRVRHHRITFCVHLKTNRIIYEGVCSCWVSVI